MPCDVSPWFLELARCPASGSKLTSADVELVARLNEAIAAGKVQSTSGEQVSRPVEGGLVDAPLTRLYPIRDGIVNLVAGDSLSLVELNLGEAMP